MKNFYVLYGLDKTLIHHELKKLLDKLQIDDIIFYDMSTKSITDVIEDASTISMFGEKKVLVLEECNFLMANKTIDQLDGLEKYIEHFNSDTYCILIAYTEKLDARKKVYKLLKSAGEIREFSKTDQKYFINYIQDYTTKEGYQIENASYFLERVGTNLGNIQNELDKLMMYCFDEKIIKNEDVDKVTVRSIEEEIFALSDAIIARNVSKSFTLLDNFLNKNYDEIQIIMLLASQFRFLFQVKRLLNQNKSEGEIAKILEVNPYRVKFTLKKLYYYTEDILLDYIQKLAKIDHDIKLGLMNKKLALELFILGITS